MTLFFWNTQLETGDHGIDKQHQKLFNLTNSISSMVTSGGELPAVSTLIDELMAYAATHFRDEEQLLPRSTLSEAAKAQHICAHRNFVTRVQELAARTDLKQADALSELLDFMVTWLVMHILKMDHQLVQALPHVSRPGSSADTAISVERILISALNETERRFRLVFEQAPTMIWLCGLSGVRDFVNKRWLEFVGCSDDLQDGIDWMDLVHPDDLAGYRCFIEDRIGSQEQGEIEYRVRMADGQWGWVLERVIPRVDGDRFVGLVAAATDVTAIKKSEKLLAELNETLEREVAERTRQLELLALADPLTSLANRRALECRLSAEVTRVRRYGRPLSMLYFDVDNFKRVNDCYGHAAGDEVLIQIARGFESRLRSTDLLSRIGGEEFVVLLVETPLAEAEAVAEELRQSVGSLQFAQVPERISISIGIAAFEEGDDPVSLLARADEAMLTAKRAGRDRCCVIISPRDCRAGELGNL